MWVRFFTRLMLGLVMLMLSDSFIELTPPPAARAQGGQTTVTVTSITIPTHAYDQALVYLTNPTYNMSYARLDRSRYDSGRLIDRTYNLIILENDYLKVSLLPELGGRIYQTIFKPTGHNMFYQNPVLKPSPWGPPEMGWWLAAGGMEWGLPVEEHGYEWGLPWSYQITDLPDGAMVELWDTTAADRLRARVAVTLPDEAAFFQVSPTIENPTGQPIDYKFWLNAMLAPGPANSVSPNLRIIMPTTEVTVHSTGDSRLPGPWAAAGWPIHNGVDWSRLGHWHEWYGFFQRPRAAGDFQAVYDEGYDEGVVRTYDSRVGQGAKFFAFGSGSTAISPDLYTDDGSSYVEMHGGVAPTFADVRRLEAGASINWTERWYPVAGLGSLTWANDRLALSLQDSADTTRLNVAVTHAVSDARILLLRRATNEVLYEEHLVNLQPGLPYHSPLLTLPNLAPADMAVVVYDSNDTLLGAYQYQGGLPVTPTPTSTIFPGSTPTPTSTPTPSPVPAWQGRLLRTIPINGWSSIARIWVRNKIGLPVTIAGESGSWRTTGKTGTKPEYGLDALEFAPLAPGVYLITPQGLNTTFRLNLLPSTIAEVLFEEGSLVATQTATPSPTLSPTTTVTPLASTTPTATPTVTGTPTASPTSTATHTPVSTPTPTLTPAAPATPTPAPISAWNGRVRRLIPITGWSSVARLWVNGQRQTAVTLSALNWHWQATGYTGSKPEYGPDALEFAPLPPGRYRASVPKLSTQFDFDLPAGAIVEVIFEQAAPPTPTTAATPTFTSTPSPTSTATPTTPPTFASTPSPTPTATAIPTASPPFTSTPSPTSTATPTVPPTASPTGTATLTPTPTDTPLPTLPPSETPTASPEPTITPTATGTSTPALTPTSTPTPPPPAWRVSIPTNTTIPGNWFAVIRVSVEGQARLPVRLTLVDNGQDKWSTTCLTGTKPEYGPYFCEFAPLIPGRYRLAPAGIDLTTTLEVGRSGVAVVIFEPN